MVYEQQVILKDEVGISSEALADVGISKEEFDEIGHEWKLNTKEKVMNSDSLIYSLMTDSKFNLPKVLPDNEYAGFEIKLSN